MCRASGSLRCRARRISGEKPVGEKPRYLSYLLRLWLACDDQAPVWRILLENAQTGQRQDFVSLEALLAFMQEEIGAKP